MNKRATKTEIATALRDLDPAPTSTALTAQERDRADAMLDRILATPSHEHIASERRRPRRRRGRVMIPVGLAAAAVPAYLLGTGGNAFGTWTPKPEALSTSAAAAAAATCTHGLEQNDKAARVLIAERRGGWTYVLFAGPKSEASCLMPDGLVRGTDAKEGQGGFFGSYDTDPPQAPTVAADGLDEIEFMGGEVTVAAALPFSTDKGWFSWVNGYVGKRVTGVTVHPPVGPDVEASVAGGRFAAWWPAGEANGENPGVSEASTYTVTLVDGSTREIAPSSPTS